MTRMDSPARLQDGDEQVSGLPIQSGHRFVEDEDAGVCGEQAREGDAAHLPSGEVVNAS